MHTLPFRRIAIFQPDLVLSNHRRPTADRNMLHELVLWQAQARARGADAVYPRLRGMAAPAQQAILQQLLQHPDMALLAPLAFLQTGIRPAGWHLNGAEVLPLAPAKCWMGRSCHSVEDVQRALREGMDYVYLSPVFSTRSHPDAQALGLANLHRICAEVDIPVFALGGIDEKREKDCRLAGAYGIAGIRMFLR